MKIENLKDDERFLLETFRALKKQKVTIDLGKIYARPAEVLATELLQEKFPEVIVEDFVTGNNNSGADVLFGKKLRIQVKLRQGALHFATTRRHSKKNQNESAKTGQIQYSSDEFDIVFIIIPNWDDMKNSETIAIPIWELKDPKNPEYLIPRIPAPIRNKYKGKSFETVWNEYNKK